METLRNFEKFDLEALFGQKCSSRGVFDSVTVGGPKPIWARQHYGPDKIYPYLTVFLGVLMFNYEKNGQ